MLLPVRQKEGVPVFQEGLSPASAALPGLSSGHRLPLPRALPLSAGLPQCLALICCRKSPWTSCLFPLISQVPTGTWEVGCAQRLERKLQLDNSEGQCSADVISTSLLRPEEVVFFSIFLQVTLLLHPARCLSASV